MRAKALATRMANKAKRHAEKAKVQEVEGIKGAVIHLSEIAEYPEGLLPDVPDHRLGLIAAAWSVPKPFDWENCTLTEAVNKQADMKREYDRISEIVLRR